MELPIDANISEIDGPHYPVRLACLPHVGDLIDLYSFIDTATKHPPAHRYEVVRVVHKMYDVTDKVSEAADGHHFVTVVVRQSNHVDFDYA